MGAWGESKSTQECAYTKHVYSKPVNLNFLVELAAAGKPDCLSMVLRNLPLPSLNRAGKLSAGFPASWAIRISLTPYHSTASERGTWQTTSNPQTCSFVPDSGASALRLHQQQVTSPSAPAEKNAVQLPPALENTGFHKFSSASCR